MHQKSISVTNNENLTDKSTISNNGKSNNSIKQVAPKSPNLDKKEINIQQVLNQKRHSVFQASEHTNLQNLNSPSLQKIKNTIAIPLKSNFNSIANSKDLNINNNNNFNNNPNINILNNINASNSNANKIVKDKTPNKTPDKTAPKESSARSRPDNKENCKSIY